MSEKMRELISREIRATVDRQVADALEAAIAKTRAGIVAELSAELRAYTAAEIKRQITEMKSALDKELVGDFKKIRAACKKDSTAAIAGALVPTTGCGTVALADDRIVAIAQETAVAAVNAAAVEIYRKLDGTIGEMIAPHVSEMIKYVDAKTQDGQDIVDKYRLATEKQYSHDASSRRVDASGNVLLVL